MAKQLNCPSCGASVKVRSGISDVNCQYCGNTLVMQTDKPSASQQAGSSSETGKSCGRAVVIMFLVGTLLTIGVAGLIVFIASSEVQKPGAVSSIVSTAIETDLVVTEFGGTGTGPGYFTEPKSIAIDGNGRIYVGELETGRIQIFDSEGKFIDQWSFADNGEVYLMAMSCSSDGTLYMVYNSEINIHNGESGQHLGYLRHPDGWGFEDVDVSPDGRILGAWYCNSDDLMLFDEEGNAEFLIRGAVSEQTGDSELSMMVAAGNMGDFYVYGLFNVAVFLFNDRGRFQDKFGSEDMFTSPSGMDIDPMGRLWMSDFGELLLFDLNGGLISRIDLGVTVYDFVISSEMQLYGVTYDDTVVQIDLSTY